VNTGNISSSLQLAIDVNGTGAASIYNAGKIMGFVDLTEQNDLFINQAGGVFETKKTSFFSGGTDLFLNQAGGTVQAATNANAAEMSGFEGLETFQNMGTISTVDGGVGDVFTIANMPGTGLNFSGSGGSTLAVDAFLGGPGSTADNFVVQGNVSGSTTVEVNNTNTGPGVFNPVGIPVVFVTGATPTGNEFSLAQPIDTGFFDYDLFFTPTGSGHWDLMSYPGAGAHLLPQLVTAAQDIWHQGSSTWFDRTADLRVLLAGGPAPAAYNPGGKSLSAPAPDNFTPAVWMRGSGGWLDRDDSASTTAYGRTYNFNLDRELETIDFQMGIDFGKKDFFSQGDALVFGLLGGFVHGDLDYDNIARSFNFDGGQVGAYATYLNGGLFVDTLFNAHLYSLDTDTLGFPDSLDANTLGIRTDAGYRFGSFSGGPFLEPLATLEVTWADIDGFSLGGNTVSFDDAANVRGRLGARAGTTMQAWEGTMMEPFVIGSLWGNFTDDNQATLVSTGRTFRYQDNLDDVWGEVSGGVNFFNFSQTTSVFAKVDVTFGDDVSGVGGKAGMRVAW
ncbi:MAG TPA: autotransporter outer membrane beta-barrel domain-containing protein, partial [Methyloceanibacter sp.]|nr:autotransporter outer membrane beta-barrel domain-containing protein [Methyloceanibacter sp.]